MTSLASPMRCMAQMTMYIGSISHQRCQFEALAGSIWWLLCQPSPLASSRPPNNLDIPAGPAIVLTAGALWLLSLVAGPRASLWRQAMPNA